MNEKYSTPQFEARIRQSFGIPEIRSEFVDQVYDLLMLHAEEKSKKPRFLSGLRPEWAIAFAVLVLMIIGMLMIGPQRIYAAVLQLFGYIPGVGIVDVNTPIRVLAEPVSLTRDEVTFEITSGILTADQTRIKYRIFGVSGSAYPDSEDDIGCIERPYLLLPDGSRLEADAPVPANVDTVTYVMPCIFNTLPGTTPTDWKLPLLFIAAPPDMTIMPVIELSPPPIILMAENMDTPTERSTPRPTSEEPAVTVRKEIETEDGYILVGLFQPPMEPGERFEVTGTMLTDASGKEIPYTWPTDVELDAQSAYSEKTDWAVQFKASGLTYPLTMTFSGVPVFEPDPNVIAKFSFDTGTSPKIGQEWELNQDIQLAGHTLKLVSVTVNSQGGYSFRFQGDKVYGVSIQIEGFTPIGGGGGRGQTENVFTSSLSYAQLPTGTLTVTISHLFISGDPLTWQGQWTPTNSRVNFPTPQPGLCLDVNALPDLNSLPDVLARGSALVYEQLTDSNQWGLVLYKLENGSAQVIAKDSTWGALSPDGKMVAYSAFFNSQTELYLFDLNSQTTHLHPNASGYGYNWSPDGKQIAFISSNGGIFNVDANGTNLHQISDVNNGAIAGWSPDGTQLYFAVPYTGGAAWKVYAYNFFDGEVHDLFTIENGTPKFLNPKLSRDGNWIAYRGQDNRSLYVVRTDGSDMHLVIDSAGVVGIDWARSGWLGLSLRATNSTESMLLIIQPDGCEAYQASFSLKGDLQGLYIP